MQQDVKKDGEYIFRVVENIADGYDWNLIEYSNEDDDPFYVVRVENPDYKPDDGSDPYMAIHLPANQEVW